MKKLNDITILFLSLNSINCFSQTTDKTTMFTTPASGTTNTISINLDGFDKDVIGNFAYELEGYREKIITVQYNENTTILTITYNEYMHEYEVICNLFITAISIGISYVPGDRVFILFNYSNFPILYQFIVNGSPGLL